MKVTEHFTQSGKNTLVSFEVLPPLKGGSMQAIFNTLDALMEFKPPFIDVTYHREEYITAIRKRPGTVGICAAIMHRYKVDAVPHLICGGFSVEETENALIDLNFLGINNVLALRGDARQFEDKFIPEADGHKFALDLVKQISGMNVGKYLDAEIVNGEPSEFCIGVAGYPEKHFESPNWATDLQYTKQKVDVPIVPGLKPLTRKYQLASIPRKFFVNMPDDLVNAVLLAKDDEAVRQIGIEWCTAQSLELKKAGVPCIHYYTMGDTATSKAIAEKVV
jgi:methylenetetrahydrofolate reductase (NADPH)